MSSERVSGGAAYLQTLLGLSDEELLRVLDSDALALITGAEDDRLELRILLVLLVEAGEHASPATLRRWLRAAGPGGRPLDRLLAHDFAGFEDALGQLAERGFVLRGGGGA